MVANAYVELGNAVSVYIVSIQGVLNAVRVSHAVLICYNNKRKVVFSMANPNSLPCYEKTSRKNTIQRALDLIILVLLLSLLAYRLFSLNNHGFTWLLAFLCESWFTFIWILTVNAKWSPVDYKTYPDHLLQRVPEAELPPVDMFVTTADPVLEPPIIVVNTVLSLLAVDYPANKLACYVSDDGCSLLTFYSLVQALEFAKLWVPFCRKYSIGTRAPFRYFSGSEPGDNASPGFRQEMEKMMEEYNQLSRKIQVAVQNSASCDLTGAYAAFSDTERSNHSSIIKVIWDNKEGLEDGLPHLVYISREKRPKHPHHYKAGAMNVLTRVSGVMTNAPFMLNVDCDMYANNPHIALHAMCLFLGAKQERDCGFVQSPQIFYDGLKDDPFGNQMVVLGNTIGMGLVGIQGPLYGGTGCFHRRKIIYGSSPDDVQNERKSFEGLEEQFGYSIELTKSAAQALSGLKGETASLCELPSSLRAAHEVAGCGYEYGTSWGEKVGWSYGSTTEDVLTGIQIHARGWKSIFCTPDPPAFLGCAPSGGPATMTQMKRWATGLLEILFSSNCPFIATFTGKLQFRQCLAYSWILLWGLRSIPELCYAVLPAFCIISNSSFLPKIQEPAIVIPVSLFVIYNLYTIYEYFKFGLSIRAWWNNQRMVRITSASAWFFGVLSVVLKLLGISETVFEITQKDQQSSGDGTDSGRFTFDESIAFVPGTTLVLVHLTALVTDILAFRQPSYGGKDGAGMGEFFCSVWVLLMFSPFVKGLFGKGKYGIPFSILCKSGALALLFVSLCINGLRFFECF